MPAFKAVGGQAVVKNKAKGGAGTNEWAGVGPAVGCVTPAEFDHGEDGTNGGAEAWKGRRVS